jgi:N-dimethylarginine dimethylaminohydrolase
MKSCYTRDSVIAVDGGAIVTRLGPPIRRGEEWAVTRTLARIGMPILRTIHGNAIVEGGSFVWLNAKTAVLGLSSRVNEEGARQLEEVLRVMGVELLRVHLTGYRLHIDGALVMIDVDTAIINPTQLPFWFLQKLDELKIRTIEVCPRGRCQYDQLPRRATGPRDHDRSGLGADAREARPGGHLGRHHRLRQGLSRRRRHPLLHRAAHPRRRVIH